MSAGRPPKCIAAVQAELGRRKATTRQLCEATGFSRSAVETALAQMRREGLPECDNFQRERAGGAPPIGRPPVNAGKSRYAESAVLGNPDTTLIVAMALLSRTPLERAWGGPAA